MTTEEKIKVMQAHVDGKTIQIYDDGEWEDWDDPEWNWCNRNYRVKPEYEGPYCNLYWRIDHHLINIEPDGKFVRREAFDRLKECVMAPLLILDDTPEWQEILRLSRGEE